MTTHILHPTFSFGDILQSKIEDASLKKSVRTRFRLMKSVYELLNNRSLQEIRNVDITDNAGVSYGVLNLHYKDKFELTVSLLEYFLQEFHNTFAESEVMLDQGRDIYLTMFDAIYYHLTCAVHNIGVYRLLLLEPNLDPRLAEHFARTTSIWISKLESQLPNSMLGKKLSRLDKRTMARVISGTLDEAIRELYLRHTYGDEPYPVDKLCEMITVLRYRAMFLEDPSPESMKRARKEAKTIHRGPRVAL